MRYVKRHNKRMCCESINSGALALTIMASKGDRDVAEKGGYECEFMKPPAKEFQSECPVCLLVLREPHTVSCCGKTFCEACIGRLKKAKKRCPTCNATRFTLEPDEALKTSLSYIRVRCSNQKCGCQWIGTLGDLDAHLNISAPDCTDTVGCEFTPVECKYCYKQYHRHLIPDHESNDCSKRPYTCSNCQMKDTHENITKTHWFECQKTTLEMKINALQKKQSASQYSSYVLPALLISLSAIAIGVHHYNATEQTSPPLPTHTPDSSPNDNLTNQALLVLEERLKALEYDVLGNMKGIEDNMASMKTQLDENNINCNGQIETALTELKREFQLKIDALQRILDATNSQLEQCMITATNLHTKLQDSLTNYDRKLEVEKTERKKEDDAAMVLIMELKNHHHEHGGGGGGCRGKGKGKRRRH